jgi:hypothetical protein
MQRVNNGEPPVFWCPRCGTLKMTGGVPEFEEPKLVDRATRLCAMCEGDPLTESLLAAVAESVGLH